MNLSIIILSKTDTIDLHTMTMNCINSLMETEHSISKELLLIESNKDYFNSDFKYPDFVNVIVPGSDFNFHKFLNIGIKASKGDYIALCNNDLIFHEHWFSAILEIANKNKDILSFSPKGTAPLLNQNAEFSLGYKVRTHVNGWCIVAKKELFDKIGLLDEKFDFFYADNDYAMTLKRRNIKHARVHNSHVIHLEKPAAKKSEKTLDKKKDFLKRYKIPDYLWRDDYKWVLETEKNLSGFLKFHDKWGSPVLYYRKNKICDILMRYKLGFLNWFVLGFKF
ncbi:glycosyltransferase [Flavobacterium aquidurense]|uniref:glycosyltransferase family 2 protein n=1 Tax=Flavobacterium aquidurense TaxID=362413 RepID=UPI002862410B|nr:glycosyltransferase [Flavobacterium aquidurense]MDR7372326.1 GT2 family glycosyltransferase [Flavobacterium aquidurense]